MSLWITSLRILPNLCYSGRSGHLCFLLYYKTQWNFCFYSVSATYMLYYFELINSMSSIYLLHRVGVRANWKDWMAHSKHSMNVTLIIIAFISFIILLLLLAMVFPKITNSQNRRHIFVFFYVLFAKPSNHLGPITTPKLNQIKGNSLLSSQRDGCVRSIRTKA